MTIGGFADSANQVCYACHAEKRGPFLWEHAPVRESCLNCHRPHGSHNDKLLTQDGNGLCLQCHYEVTFNPDDNWGLDGMPHSGLRLSESRCYDCHREIHGSNVSPTYLDR